MDNYTTTFGGTVADAIPAERAAFIRKTYIHLAGAILAFIGLQFVLFSSGLASEIAMTMLGSSWSWLMVLAAFMGISMLANWWATSQTSKGLQYLGLGLFTIAEAIIFVPLLYMVQASAGADVIVQAGMITIGLFLGITAVVFLTRKDFSFLGPILMIGGFVSLGFIVVSLVFGFSLGIIFAYVMVAFAGASILYETSNVMHRYNTNQHVAASLSLFASIALLFWYILRIFSSRD